jgi:alkylated DNA repair protein (DNA oxidative demethylase)
MTPDLFAKDDLAGRVEAIGPESFVLRGLALPRVPELLAGLGEIEAAAPFRHLVTPGGFTMSVATTNCGRLGWTSDRRGYRYTAQDPDSGRDWPAMPPAFTALAVEAALQAGFAGFVPDACLINRYRVGTKLSLHQDKDEEDYRAPIVSVSLGVDAVFQFGGLARSERPARLALRHGDVVVWGGVDRLRFHGVLPLKGGVHPVLGEQRINLTFRKAGALV